MAFDPFARRLYIPCDTHVIVVDADALKVVGDISGISGVHSVLPVPELGRGFTANRSSDTISIFDLQSLKLLGTVKVGDAPHNMAYDRTTKRLFTMNTSSRDVTVLDAVRGQVIGAIPLGGKPNSGVWDGKGRLLIDFMEQDQVVQVDTARLAVTARWSIAPGKWPVAIAYDFRNQRLFVGCLNKRLIVLDAVTGKVTASLPIGAGVNGVRYDPAAHAVFTSNGDDGTLTVLHEDSPGRFVLAQNVRTARGAGTLSLDPLKHNIYTVGGKRGSKQVSGTLEMYVIANSPQ
jgi:DNA-binding beta-propeller fold protein YncE